MSPSTPRPNAFTLVEILVVLFLSGVLLALVFWTLSANQSVTRQGLTRSEVFAAGRDAGSTLATDFRNLLGPLPNPVTTPYPDRDAATLGPLLDAERPRGCLIVVPAVRRGHLPMADGSLGPAVDLRCDQLFFFADMRRGGIAPGMPDSSLYRSLLTPNLSATQASVWVGPVSSDDELTAADGLAEAATWCLGRQVVLLKDLRGKSGPRQSFQGSGLSPLDAGRENLDSADFLLEDDAPPNQAPVTGVSHWIMDQYAAPGKPPAAVDGRLIKAFAIPVPANAPVPMPWPWPKVGSDPGKGDRVTPGQLAGNHRVFLRRCSECIIQVGLDANGNGLADTTNLTAAGAPDPLSAEPWDGSRLPQRDLVGDVVWTPSDQDFNKDSANAAGARSPLVFWPHDAQPRIVHYGYYQGPDASKYWKNAFGDWTPYPPVPLDRNDPTVQVPFGDAIEYGDYVNCDWNVASAYAAHAVVKSDGDLYLADAAITGGDAPSSGAPGWARLPAGDVRRRSPADYAMAMTHYETLHGWNPTAQRLAGPANNPLHDKPPPAQSSWPTLVRIRVRLHDRGGVVRAHADDFLSNGRDDDGDGLIDNAQEAGASGIWFEYIFVLPYPRLQTPDQVAPAGTAP